MKQKIIYLPWKCHDKISKELLKEIWYYINWDLFIDQLKFEASTKSLFPEKIEEKKKIIEEFYKFVKEFER